MYRHILVATDGTKESQTAILTAVQLASLLMSKVTAIAVTAPLPMYASVDGMLLMSDDTYDEVIGRTADEWLQFARDAARDRDIAIEAIRVESEHPWREIIDKAGTHGCDLIVMGSHGRTGIERLIIGSQTQKVLAHTVIPVLVTR